VEKGREGGWPALCTKCMVGMPSPAPPAAANGSRQGQAGSAHVNHGGEKAAVQIQEQKKPVCLVGSAEDNWWTPGLTVASSSVSRAVAGAASATTLIHCE